MELFIAKLLWKWLNARFYFSFTGTSWPKQFHFHFLWTTFNGKLTLKWDSTILTFPENTINLFTKQSSCCRNVGTTTVSTRCLLTSTDPQFSVKLASLKNTNWFAWFWWRTKIFHRYQLLLMVVTNSRLDQYQWRTPMIQWMAFLLRETLLNACIVGSVNFSVNAFVYLAFFVLLLTLYENFVLCCIKSVCSNINFKLKS